MLVLEKGKVVEFGNRGSFDKAILKELFLEQDLKQVIRNNAGM